MAILKINYSIFLMYRFLEIHFYPQQIYNSKYNQTAYLDPTYFLCISLNIH